MKNPGNPELHRWDPVCISLITLATAVLVGLFTLVGVADEVLQSKRLQLQAMVTGALAITAYFACLAYGYSAIFTDSVTRKRSRSMEAAAIFTVEVMAVVATATFVVWAKLESITLH